MLKHQDASLSDKRMHLSRLQGELHEHREAKQQLEAGLESYKSRYQQCMHHIEDLKRDLDTLQAQLQQGRQRVRPQFRSC